MFVPGQNHGNEEGQNTANGEDVIVGRQTSNNPCAGNGYREGTRITGLDRQSSTSSLESIGVSDYLESDQDRSDNKEGPRHP